MQTVLAIYICKTSNPLFLRLFCLFFILFSHFFFALKYFGTTLKQLWDYLEKSWRQHLPCGQHTAVLIIPILLILSLYLISKEILNSPILLIVTVPVPWEDGHSFSCNGQQSGGNHNIISMYIFNNSFWNTPLHVLTWPDLTYHCCSPSPSRKPRLNPLCMCVSNVRLSAISSGQALWARSNYRNTKLWPTYCLGLGWVLETLMCRLGEFYLNPFQLL